MTRKDELKQLAYTTVRAMIADGVKLSGGQYVVSEYAVFKALQQVEREALERVAAYAHSRHNNGYTLEDVSGCGNEGDIITASSNDEARSIEQWVRSQQKELG